MKIFGCHDFVKTKLFIRGNLLIMESEKKLSRMEIFYMALADKTRLRLLNLMREGEICVCFLVEVLGESQPKISRHLAYLRSAGIVETRRDGKWIHYKISEPEDDFAAKVLRDTLLWLDSQEKMRAEYEKLTAVCCSSERTVTTAFAPRRQIYVPANIKRAQSEELETFLL